MVKIKKKYTEFINEELTAKEKLSDAELSSRVSGLGRKDSEEKFLLLRYKFWDNIIDMTEDLRPRSFSDMCKRNTNPEEDYKEMQSLMDKKGWDIQSIKNLFSTQVDEICGYDIGDLVKGKKTDKFNKILDKLDSEKINTTILNNIQDPFRNNNTLDEQNGHTDIYLYFTFKQLGLNQDFIELGGYGWATHDEPEELFIRYAYGYHQTEYGKLLLKQNGMTESEFIESALTQLHIHIKDQLYDVIWRSFVKKYEGTKSKDFIDSSRTNILNLTRRINFEEISIIESDRLIIDFISLSDILEEEIGVEFPTDELVSSMVKFLSPLKLSYFVSDGDLVIKTKE
jgi:hypothetical protein